MDHNQNSSSKYFAQLTGEKLGAELIRRVNNYYEYLGTYGRANLWRRAWIYYLKNYFNAGQLITSGVQGEYTIINVNHFRNLLQHWKNNVSQTRPAYDAIATNSDYKSQAQTVLASQLLAYELRHKRLERDVKTALEYSLIFGEGFLENPWDPAAGPLYQDQQAAQQVDSGQPATNTTQNPGVPDSKPAQHIGDIEYNVYTPFDVIRDYSLDKPGLENWQILRSYKNKYDLMTEYPEYSDKIEQLNDNYDQRRLTSKFDRYRNDQDIIPFYRFYHKKTAAMPQGRVVEFLSGDIILVDSPLPYEKPPVHRLAAGEMIGTIFGYSVMFDLLPMQETLDILYSVVVSNNKTFAGQNILVDESSNLSSSHFTGGYKVIKTDLKNKAEPRPLNLLEVPQAVFTSITALVKDMETISGINSVSRGNPEANLKSGTALAIVETQAIEFASGLQQSYVQLLEDVGTSNIAMWKKFAVVPRIATIVGKNNQHLMKEFTASDLENVDRVTVEVGSALGHSLAGRIQIADNLLANKMVTEGEQYLTLIDTGQFEPLIHGPRAQLELIQSENEAISEGSNPPVSVMDDHALHIKEHQVNSASVTARQNPEVMKANQDHIQQHINLWKSADPVILAATGQQPAPMPMAPPGMPGAPPGMAPPGGPPSPSAGPMPSVAPLTPPPPTGPTMPPGVRLPGPARNAKNPVTHQEVPVNPTEQTMKQTA